MARLKTSEPKAGATPIPVLPARDSVVFPGLVHTLHVARERSRRAVRASLSQGGLIFVVSQRDMAVEDPRPPELWDVGCLCTPLQAVPLPDGSLRVALRPIRRAKALRYHSRGGFLSALCEELAETASHDEHDEALMRLSIEAFGEILEKGKGMPSEAIETVSQPSTPGALADAIAHHLPLRAGQKQSLLEELDVSARLRRVHEILCREQNLLEIKADIVARVDREFAAGQREIYLREQLRTIESELSALGHGISETAGLRDRIEEAAMSSEARERALQELARLERSASHSPESMVIRSYLEWIVELPWSRQSPDRLDVAFAKQVLEEAHFGLQKVKERILDFLAVRQLSQSLRGPILCFVGPPGVGKTSVGRSIAEAVGREFVRISLGGLRDEAEIRGHRKTYVGAHAGRLLQSLRQCGTRNPVIVLDEIDKMAADLRGDSSSALLEALDPSQNERFSDHYLEVAFDLSSILFIATANSIEDIPHALRDRLEIVRFSSYTDGERMEIARKFIVPRQIESHGLSQFDFQISEPALEEVVRTYSREAGVRELERMVAAICRKSARQFAEGRVERMRVDRKHLEGILGQPRFSGLSRIIGGEVGTANGLVVTEYGGDTIPMEAVLLENGGRAPALHLTGNLGAVMKESAEAAWTFVRSLPMAADFKSAHAPDVHIHVHENSIPKEGPSAGLTIAVALASAMSGHPVRRDLALTGEITLRGRVLPVGGVREKLVAARRAGVRVAILPAGNRSDLREVPPEILKELQIILVENAGEAIRAALEPVAQAVMAIP